MTRLNSAALGLLSYYPQPTYSTPDLVQNYRLVASGPANSQSIGVRLNAPLNNKDRLNFNVQYQSQNSASEQLFGFRDTGNGSGSSASMTWNHSFAPRFNNSAVLSYSRNTSQTNPYFATAGINVAGALGIAGTSQLPIDFGPPSISISNFGGLSDSAFSVNRSQTLSLTDTVTYVWKRKHNLSFGYLFRVQDNDPRSEKSARGSFSFDGIQTSQLVQNPVTGSYSAAPGTGFALADFLLGLPYTTSIQLGSNDYFRSWSTAAFVTDDYRLGRNLTLNLGLRYEFFAPSTEKYNRLANLDLNPSPTQASVVTPSQNFMPGGSVVRHRSLCGIAAQTAWVRAPAGHVLTAHRTGFPSVGQTQHRASRRLQHLLQRRSVFGDRDADGGAASVYREPDLHQCPV